jgi:hypothetical protein
MFSINITLIDLRLWLETSPVILSRFLHRRIVLEKWFLIPLLFVVGHLFGRWHNRRWRYDRVGLSSG